MGRELVLRGGLLRIPRLEAERPVFKAEHFAEQLDGLFGFIRDGRAGLLLRGDRGELEQRGKFGLQPSFGYNPLELGLAASLRTNHSVGHSSYLA